MGPGSIIGYDMLDDKARVTVDTTREDAVEMSVNTGAGEGVLYRDEVCAIIGQLQSWLDRTKESK